MAIPIKAPGARTRILPPKGVHGAVICDVVDRGEVETEWDGKKRLKHKVSVHFLLAKKIPMVYTHPYTGEKLDAAALNLAGRQFGVSQWFTASLDKRAAYRAFLESLLERPLSREELDSHDAEDFLLGLQCQLVIKHRQVEKNGETEWFANIDSVMPFDGDEGIPVPVPADYVRIKDREGDSPGAYGKPAHKIDPASDEDEDDIPF